MSHLEQIAFNLIINSSCSFFAGILVVGATLRLFRIGDSRWKLFFLTLPFIKIIWDIIHGIPSSSVIFSGINPLSLPPKHQTLTIGAGFTEYGPIFNLQFSAQDLTGKVHATSLADYIAVLAMKYIHPWVPGLTLLAILVVATILLGRCIYYAIRFEINRQNQRMNDTTIQRVQLKCRNIDIYRSDAYTGTPFTGGIFHPYICFPSDTFIALTDAEREAVIQHEIAHILQWDLLTTFAIRALGNVFWFVPFYRFLSRKIDKLREISADKIAVKLGASADQLASALIKLKEVSFQSPQPVLFSAFLREPSLLKLRVGELLSTSKKPESRLGWNNRWARILIAAWTTGAVMIATFGGNVQMQTHLFPQWVEKMMDRWK